ncbi:hypothetical protein [Plantibacter cousiniae (nom. nud.)]|uniref:Uncharacterized protein n=1 Tax=Plantibacter cousiniae (nom. nud.) TaxID=199709 RepID=A0ABY1LHB5_9MICO|nr:hypothetical protein [Plantibacter cousiniae]SKC40717.1 hypothetical protein SAMN06295973_0644 [Plantibacter cousiniae]
MTLPFPASPDDTLQRRPLREALADAVLQDFIDDLPIPLRPTDLATRLLYPRWQVYSDIHEGRLVAERVRNNKRLLKIDVERNRAWIARGLTTRRARAGSTVGEAGPESPVSVVIVDPEALAQLNTLTATGLSVREAVELALTALGSREAATTATVPDIDSRGRQVRAG